MCMVAARRRHTATSSRAVRPVTSACCVLVRATAGHLRMPDSPSRSCKAGRARVSPASELRKTRCTRVPYDDASDDDDDSEESNPHLRRVFIVAVACVSLAIACIVVVSIIVLEGPADSPVPAASLVTPSEHSSASPLLSHAHILSPLPPLPPSASPASPRHPTRQFGSLLASPARPMLVPMSPSPPGSPLPYAPPPTTPPPLVPSPPTPPPQAPSPNFPVQGSASALVATLNEQWIHGEPSNDIRRAGILLHTFDNTEDDVTARMSLGLPGNVATATAEPWLPCNAQAWCGMYHGRFSASIVNHHQNQLFQTHSTAGVILSPSTGIFCSYPVDGGTMEKFCPPDAPPGCAPGCADTEGNPNWCAHDEAWTISVSSQVWSCAFRPTDLEAMLRHHLFSRAHQYNEVVVDTNSYASNLPESLLAIFYLRNGPNGGDSSPGADKARAVHQRFLNKYPQQRTPLVSLDTSVQTGAFRLVWGG